MHFYSAEHFVALEKRVQGPKFVDRLPRERPAHMLAHKAPEPLTQSASLVGDLIQFARRRPLGQRIQGARRNQVGLTQPRDEAVAAVERVNRRVDRRRD
jgi:hypothetical protein